MEKVFLEELWKKHVEDIKKIREVVKKRERYMGEDTYDEIQKETKDILDRLHHQKDSYKIEKDQYHYLEETFDKHVEDIKKIRNLLKEKKKYMFEETHDEIQKEIKKILDRLHQ